MARLLQRVGSVQALLGTRSSQDQRLRDIEDSSVIFVCCVWRVIVVR